MTLQVRISCKNPYFPGGLYSNSRLPAVLFLGGVFPDAGYGGVLFPTNHRALLLIQYCKRHQGQAKHEASSAHCLGYELLDLVYMYSHLQNSKD